MNFDPSSFWPTPENARFARNYLAAKARAMPCEEVRRRTSDAIRKGFNRRAARGLSEIERRRALVFGGGA